MVTFWPAIAADRCGLKQAFSPVILFRRKDFDHSPTYFVTRATAPSIPGPCERFVRLLDKVDNVYLGFYRSTTTHLRESNLWLKGNYGGRLFSTQRPENSILFKTETDFFSKL